MKTKEIKCKSAVGKCGFPGGGLAINPYIGCTHGCAYCYARFMRRFTGHTEEWGSFVDVKTNIADILKKQMGSLKYEGERIYIGTVTDPYQPAEENHGLTREILRVLAKYDNPISVLTKSDLILRDIDLLKKMKEVEVNFTVNSLNERWERMVEPGSSTVKHRLEAMESLSEEGVSVFAMMGPYWPFFTETEILFKEFKRVGTRHVFTESLNTVGGNWIGVENILKDHYPELLPEMKRILFNESNFHDFYTKARDEMEKSSKMHGIPFTAYFGRGHASKFS